MGLIILALLFRVGKLSNRCNLYVQRWRQAEREAEQLERQLYEHGPDYPRAQVTDGSRIEVDRIDVDFGALVRGEGRQLVIEIDEDGKVRGRAL